MAEPGIEEFSDVLAVRSVDGTLPVSSSSSEPVSSMQSNRPAMSPKAAIRKAQSILKELQGYDIGLPKIAAEGFDLSILDLLLRDPSPLVKLSTQQAPDDHDTGSTGKKGRREPLKDFVLRNGKVDPPSVVSAATKASDASPCVSENQPTEDTQNGTAVDGPQPMTAHTGGDRKDLTMAQPGNAIGRKAESKSQSREDYIARLLAARSGKAQPAPSRIVSSSTKTSQEHYVPVTTNMGTQKAVSSSSDMPTRQPQPEMISQDPNTLPGLRASELEAKKKADTDLVRQKMEALKAQREARPQGPMTDFEAQEKANSKDISGTEVLTESEKSLKSPIIIPVAQRQSSYFSLVNQQAPFNLPGLFTAPENNKSNPQISPNDDHVPQHKPQDLGRRENSSPHSEHAKLGLEQNTIATSPTSLKRASPADFADSPSAKVRGSLTRSENINVIIDISDDEDDLDHDHDKDDPPDESPNSKLAKTKSQALFRANSESQGRRLRQMEDRPATVNEQIQGPGTNSGAAPAAKNTQRPSDVESLRFKEREIQQINQKIAELESRIKAKQAVSRAQSPRNPGSAQGEHSDFSTSKGKKVSSSPPSPTNLGRLQEDIRTHAVPSQATIPDQKQDPVNDRLKQGQNTNAINSATKTDHDRDLQVAFASELTMAQNLNEVTPSARSPEQAYITVDLSSINQEILKMEEKLAERKFEIVNLEKRLTEAKVERTRFLQQQNTQQSSVDVAQITEPSAADATNVSDCQIGNAVYSKPAPSQDSAKPSTSGSQPIKSLNDIEDLDRPGSTSAHVTFDQPVPPDFGKTSANDEDRMDISQSELDPAEALNGSLADAQHSLDAMDTAGEDDDEQYEPPNEIAENDRMEGLTDLDQDNLSESTEISVAPVKDGTDNLMSDRRRLANESLGNKEQPSHSLADVDLRDESDEYEPPDPIDPKATTSIVQDSIEPRDGPGHTSPLRKSEQPSSQSLLSPGENFPKSASALIPAPISKVKARLL